MINLVELKEAAGQVYNIGNDQEITILELAKLVKEMTGSASEIVCIPYDQAYEAGFEDMRRRVPDLTKIKAAVGYEPKMDTRAIIASVIEHEKTKL